METPLYVFFPFPLILLAIYFLTYRKSEEAPTDAPPQGQQVQRPLELSTPVVPPHNNIQSQNGNNPESRQYGRPIFTPDQNISIPRIVRVKFYFISPG